jgi:O-antigen/teichoic acid export membrane protein
MVKGPTLTITDTFKLLFLHSASGDHRRRRLVSVIQGAVTGFGNKVVGLIVNFLSVPLTIGYLGPERYGIWITIGSLLAWLALSDFGLGLGFNTAIATAVGQDRLDVVRQHTSTALALLAGIAGAVGLLTLLVWPWIDWSSLFGARTPLAQAEIGPAIAAAIIFWLLQFPLSITGRVFNAYQEGRLANYWGAFGNVLSLLVLIIVTQTQGGLVWLVVAMSGTGLLVNIASTLWLFLHHRPFLAPHPKDISGTSLRMLGKVGGTFFLIQILSLLVFNTDNLIVGHFLGADQVPTYSVTYSLFNYCLIIQNMIFSYMWVAYSEAIARKDIAWVKRTFHITLAAGTLLTMAFSTGLAVIAQPFIGWWAGTSVVPPTTFVLWMATWGVINGFTSPIACLLAAAAHLRNQTIYSALACALNIALTLIFVHRWGITGVIAGTVISYAIFICVPALVDVELLIRKLEQNGVPRSNRRKF